MADLIDRDALIAEYDRVHVGAPGGARKLMVDAPTVDAEPVRYAQWIDCRQGYWKCSECGAMHKIIFLSNSFDKKYCPNCGAKRLIRRGRKLNGSLLL